ncbi:hypothetical protein BCR39DRAFT_513576 [Naematelia encephala]|uniref:Something about silencing protein 4 domain-containing protein n=1 Tax=Naematelia encephala TaxID=71784 RepID=A0A1Y2BIJ5_9TREE|nr:hypothetical protein BCR39DRAFT_513576 [Naematelia encephala]
MDVRAQPQSLSLSLKAKGKQTTMRVPEKRVLPARIRRAAGTGQEGMRDLEEMVVDWLDRFGEPCATPPDSLQIHLTTVPLSMLSPPPSTVTSHAPAPQVTVTPTRATRFQPLASPLPRQAAPLDKAELIETPSWTLVRPGEDDAEEAREELALGRGLTTLTIGRGGPQSPIKRLRKPLDDTMIKDTSDAYYISLHRKYEVFERRQRIREKEKLQFERYKMRSRIDMLRTMPKPAWANVVSAIFARTDENGRWDKGKAKVQQEGTEWLQRRLLKEGAEVMQRYEELLPSEHKKTKGIERTTSSPAGTSRSPSRSVSPVPVPPRVAALREPVITKRRQPLPAATTKRRPSSPGTKMEVDEPVVDKGNNSIPETQARESRSSRAARSQSSSKSKRKRSHSVSADVDAENDITGPSQHSPSISPDAELDTRRARHHSPFFPPLTISGLPCLVEAASRRQDAQTERTLSAAGKRSGRPLVREKTRTSGRLGTIAPFGLPVPPVVEWKSEFTLTDEPDFWPVIAERQEQANAQRRQSLLSLATAGTDGVTGVETASAPSVSQGISSEDVADMREVEAAVVL